MDTSNLDPQLKDQNSQPPRFSFPPPSDLTYISTPLASPETIPHPYAQHTASQHHGVSPQNMSAPQMPTYQPLGLPQQNQFWQVQTAKPSRSALRACDRCRQDHQHCPRQSETEICERCLKSGTDCVTPDRKRTVPTTRGPRTHLRSCDRCRRDHQSCPRHSEMEMCNRCAKAGEECVTSAASRRGPMPGYVKETKARIDQLERQLSEVRAESQAENQGHVRRHVSGGSDESFGNRRDVQVSTAYRDVSGLQDQVRPRKHARPDFPEHSSDAIKQSHQGDMANELSGAKGHMTTFSAYPGLTHPSSQYTPAPMIPSNTQLNWSAGCVYGDVIDRGVLQIDLAYNLVVDFLHNMLVHLPIVFFPPTLKPHELRQTQPILFLAILTVATGPKYAEVQGNLIAEITHLFAERVVCMGEKSLEIVQALQICAAWYPSRLNDTKPFEFMNMATTMAVNLGLRKTRSRFAVGSALAAKRNDYRDHNVGHDSPVASGRAWVSCYLLSSK